MNETLTFTQTVTITGQDIDDIVATAFEGGINYWCNAARVVGKYLGKYASDQISRGGKIVLTIDEPIDDSEKVRYTLTKRNFLNGLKKYLSDPNKPYDILTVDHGKIVLDSCNIDGVVSDIIIQYALFDEIIFG